MPDDKFYDVLADKRKKKRDANGVQTRPISVIRREVEQARHERQQNQFTRIARQMGVSPQAAAYYVAAHQPYQVQWDYQQDKFKSAVAKRYGDLSPLYDSGTAEMLYQRWSLKKKFPAFQTTFNIPYGQGTVPQLLSVPQLATFAMNEIYARMAELYGDKYTAAALQIALIRDPDQANATWAALQTIAGSEATLMPNTLTSAYSLNGGRYVKPDSPDYDLYQMDDSTLLRNALSDPEFMKALPDQLKYRVIRYAQATVDDQAEVTGISSELIATRDSLMQKHGFKDILSKDEQDQIFSYLDQLPRQDQVDLTPDEWKMSPKSQLYPSQEQYNKEQGLAGGSLFTGTVNVHDALGQYGLDSYDISAGGEPVYHFNEEWAKQNFAKYEAIRQALLTRNPKAVIDFGEGNIVGQVFDVVNRDIDAIGAAPGALWVQAKELVQNIHYSPDERAEYARKAAVLRQQIADGTIAPQDTLQAMSTADDWEDKASSDLTIENFQNNAWAFSRPTHPGTGWGDAATLALDVFPGDKGYATVHAAGALVGQLLFDPTILAGKVAKAGSLAASLPAGAEVAKRYNLTQMLFDSWALEPEQFFSQPRVLSLVGDLHDASTGYRDATSFAVKLQETFGIDPEVARELAPKIMESKEGAKSALMQAMLGEGSTKFLQGEYIAKIAEADGVIDLVGNKLPSHLRSLRAKLGNLRVSRVENARQDVGVAGLDTEISNLETQILDVKNEITSRLDDYDDAIAMRAYNQDILTHGFHAGSTPIRILPTRASIRKLSIGKSSFGRMFEEASGLEKIMPDAVWADMDLKQKAEFLVSPEGKKASVGAGNFAQRARDWFSRDSGFAQTIVFETNKLTEADLPDEFGRAYDKIRDFANTLKVDQNIVDEGIAKMFAAGAEGSPSKIHDAFIDLFERMIDNSPRIRTAEDKAALKQMYRTTYDEKIHGTVTAGEGGLMHADSTVYELEEGARPRGVPVIEADMLPPYVLPNYKEMELRLRSARSYMNSLKEIDKWGAKKLVGEAYITTANAWRGFNRLWANVVLMGRMPVALPLRIQLEQMLRMEAFGYNSAVGHPLTWWKSVKDKETWDLINDSTYSALGAVLGDFKTISAKPTRAILDILKEPDAVVESLVKRMKAYYSSPSTRKFMDSKLTDAQVVEELQKSDFYWPKFQTIWDDVVKSNIEHGGELSSYEAIVKNIRTEMRQVMGSGSANKKLMDFVRYGKYQIDGQNVDDIDDIVKDVQKLYREGAYKPDVVAFPASTAEFDRINNMPVISQLSRFRDWSFRTFYGSPDKVLGRQPLARQVASREYSRLINLGFDEESAKIGAQVHAARQTADMLFTIGASSSGDMWLKSTMPFFPAWKELAETWLYKVPQALGGGGRIGWLAGAPALAARVRAWTTFFKDSGIAYEDNGTWRVKIPFMGDMFKAISGMNVDDISFSVDSVTSLLPVPSLNSEDALWKGLLPSVGAPTGVALHAMKRAHVPLAGWMEDMFTLYGGDVSLGPAAVDNALLAMGVTPPWMFGRTREMAELQRGNAIHDAIRMEYAEHYNERPKAEDYKTDKAYRHADEEWLNGIYNRAEQGAMWWYWARAIAGTTLPFSIKYGTDADRELASMWKVIRGIEDAGVDEEGQVRDTFLQGFHDAHPEFELFMTGDTAKIVPDDPNAEDTFESYKDEIAFGERQTFEPKQWLVWALGQQEAALHRTILDRVFRKFASSPQEWLLSGFESSQALTEENNRWEAYLLSTDAYAKELGVTDSKGVTVSFADMYKTYYDQKYGKYSDQNTVSLTYEQEQASKALDSLQNLSRFFGAGQLTSDHYLAIRRTLNEVLDPTYTKSKDPVFAATGRWWNQVRSYFDQKNAVWEKIDQVENHRRGKYYRQLAAIENQWASKKIYDKEFGLMPNPQEVMFNKLSPRERQVKLFGWAKLPGEWLSRYQRQKIYGPSKKDDQLDDLTMKIAENEQEFDNIVDANRLSSSSREYEDLRAAYDRKNLALAKDLGVESAYLKWQEPAYKRIDKFTSNPYWHQIVEFVDSGNRMLEAREISPRGSSAADWQVQVAEMVDDLRDKDPKLNKLLEDLGVAYGEGPDDPLVGRDLYWPLFFDGFPGFTPGYLSYGNNRRY